MRTKIWSIAALCLLLGTTSCKREMIESGQQRGNTLNFHPVVGKQAKAAETTGFEDGTRLPLFGYKLNAPDQVINDYLAYSEADYTWTPDYGPYTFDGVYLVLYSWYPETNVQNPATDNTGGSFEYQVAPTYDAQEDLLVACTQVEEPDVYLTFEHALSQINFAIAGPESVKARISNIRVNDVLSSGKVAITPDALTWGDQADKASYDYLPLDGTNITDRTTDIRYMGNSSYDPSYDNALMLMPQTFAAAEDGTFSFTIELFNPDADFENDTPVPYYTKDFTVNLCDLSTSTWKPGKRYQYTVDLSDFIRTGEMTFNVYVNYWEDASNDFGEDGGWVSDYVASTVKITTLFGLNDAFEAHVANKVEAPKLNKFPIICTTRITDGVMPTVIPEDRAHPFSPGDQFIITMPDALSAQCLDFVDLASVFWDETKKDNQIILTKRSDIAPDVDMDPSISGAPVDLTAAVLEHAMFRFMTGDTYKVFPIYATVLDEEYKLDINEMFMFRPGDIIVIHFDDAASVDYLKMKDFGAAEWDRWTSGAEGNWVTLQKKQPASMGFGAMSPGEFDDALQSAADMKTNDESIRVFSFSYTGSNLHVSSIPAEFTTEDVILIYLSNPTVADFQLTGEAAIFWQVTPFEDSDRFVYLTKKSYAEYYASPYPYFLQGAIDQIPMDKGYDPNMSLFVVYCQDDAISEACDLDVAQYAGLMNPGDTIVIYCTDTDSADYISINGGGFTRSAMGANPVIITVE